MKTTKRVQKIETVDPHSFKPRFLLEVSDLLKDVRDARSEMSIRERLASLSLLDRIIYKWTHEGAEREPDSAGSTVRKYAADFSSRAHDRAGKSARAGAVEPDRDELPWDDDPDDTAA